MREPVGTGPRGRLLPCSLGSGLGSAEEREGNPTAEQRPLAGRAGASAGEAAQLVGS